MSYKFAPESVVGRSSQLSLATWMELLEVAGRKNGREDFGIGEDTGVTVRVPPSSGVPGTENRLRHAEGIRAPSRMQFRSKNACVEAVHVRRTPAGFCCR